MTPVWILASFAAVMLVVAAVSAARLVAAWLVTAGSRRNRPVSTDTDVAHLLMAIAMAGMLVSSLTTLPDHAWEIIFGLLTAWFARRVGKARGGDCVPHLVHSAAMLYMFLALPASGQASGQAMQTLRYPTVAFAFGLALTGYCVWDLDQLSGSRHAFDGLLSPGVTVTGRIAMGVTMALMLFRMI